MSAQLCGEERREAQRRLSGSYYLELADHDALEVLGGGGAMNQPLGELLRVERLEDVLVLDVLEHHHLQSRLRRKEAKWIQR